MSAAGAIMDVGQGRPAASMPLALVELTGPTPWLAWLTDPVST
jgi:hypothetical protein